MFIPGQLVTWSERARRLSGIVSLWDRPTPGGMKRFQPLKPSSGDVFLVVSSSNSFYVFVLPGMGWITASWLVGGVDT